MYKLLTTIGLITLLMGCTAGQDYRRALGSLLNSDFITTGKDYQKVLDSWLGYDIDGLVRRWGYPTSVLETLNGNTLHVFQRPGNLVTSEKRYDRIFKPLPYQFDYISSSTFKSKVGFTALPEYISVIYSNTADGETLGFSCETMFEVNPANRITHWSYRGYDCY